MNPQAMSSDSRTSAYAALPHVLVVDDDPTIRDLVSDYLGQHELRVSAVADGHAMQVLLGAEVVDLIVLDLKLKGEDGMGLARRLRDESAIPIVMLTGRAEEADRVMGLELGADDYLTKPFSPRELLARIRTILRRRRARCARASRKAIRAYRLMRELQPEHPAPDEPAGQSVPLSNASSACWWCCSARPAAFSRATSCSTCRGCTTTRSTTARWTCRSCGCAARSRRIRLSPRYIRTERGAGYLFGVPVETVY